MQRIALIAVVFAFVSVPVRADLTFYGPGDKAAFEADNIISIVETFEGLSISYDTPLPSFVSQGVTYTGLAGTPFPNVFVTSWSYSNFDVAVPDATVLTANGAEDFTVAMTFVGPITAVGFDTYLNRYGPATITVVNDDGPTSTTLSHDFTTIGFFGVGSSSPISSIQWTTSGGAVINTGIDNVQIGVVPVPGAVLLGMLGLSVVGVKLRKRA